MEYRIQAIGDRNRAVNDGDRQLAERLVHELSRPRLSGSPGAARAGADLRRRLEQAGYEIRDLPFRFSSWPGRHGVPLLGMIHLSGSVAAAVLLIEGDPVAAGAALATVAALIVLVAGAARRAITRLPMGRVYTANWLATRPGAHPRYLVVAHRDSKSQPVSTYLRTAAIALSAFGWIALLVVAGIAALEPTWIWTPSVLGLATLAAAGGVVLSLCHAGNASPGALDNATGLAALLGIAQRERERDDVAFLVTDGEELGLAGAWDAATRLPLVDGIINLDGLDDEGAFRIAEHFGWPRRRGLAPHLAAALLSSAAALELPAERRDLPPGVWVDHIPFARAGYPAVTVLRGDSRSLRRVHRPDDAAARITGHGVAAAVALVSGALELLRGGPSGDSDPVE